jgi:hypothetical protein
MFYIYQCNGGYRRKLEIPYDTRDDAEWSAAQYRTDHPDYKFVVREAKPRRERPMALPNKQPTRPLPPGVHVGVRELRIDPQMSCPHCDRAIKPSDGRETEGHGFELICIAGHKLLSWD